MTSFSVLDRNEKIHCHKLLEASAGTGKTFAIENIVMRLLIEIGVEAKPLFIEDILVVTFTKAATRELKERIRTKLADGLHILKQAVKGEVYDSCPDYLLAKIESGTESIELAIKQLERALFCYDKAQIFTIHGFCWRMLSSYALQAGISLGAKSKEGGATPEIQLTRAVKDFLRNGLDEREFSPSQMDLLIGHFKRDEDKLVNHLVNQVRKPLPIHSTSSLSMLIAIACPILKHLKEHFGISGNLLNDDLITLKASYRKNSKIPHEYFNRFATLFDQSEWSGADIDFLILALTNILDTYKESNLLKKAVKKAPETLNYPGFIQAVKEMLRPVIDEGCSVPLLLARIASDCQSFIKEFQSREELLGHDELLISMRRAVENEEFVKQVRQQYKAAIVDEFQDTDPLQWEIFSKLFKSDNSSWGGYLYLVGDPKQSIYAFRQADIYTYLAAAEALGAEAHSTLDTNYRSTPALVNAINILFGKAQNPFPLPRSGNALPFREVKPGRKDSSGIAFTNSPLQFWLADKTGTTKVSNDRIEKALIIPKIVQELIRLKNDAGISYNGCAVLVADHIQAKNVSDYLKHCHIPVRNQRGIDLRKSPALEDMIELLYGILDGKGGSSIRVALAVRPIGMNVSDFQLLCQEDNIVPVLNQCLRLKSVLLKEGFGQFFHHMMQSKWHEDGLSVYERLLSQEGGSDYFRQWQDLADWMIHEEYRLNLTPAGIIAHLEQFAEQAGEDEEAKVYVDLDEEGVSIITMHYSKGLEFDAVFALGVIREHQTKEEELVPVLVDGKYRLEGIFGEDDPKFKRKVEEDEAEHMRRLYVALTRAKTYLYVPILLDSGQTDKKSNPSDIDLLIAKLRSGGSFGAGDHRSCIQQLAAEYPDLVSAVSLTQIDEFQFPVIANENADLIPCCEFTVPGRKEFVQSFTSLSSTHTSVSIELNEDQQVPHDYAAEVKTRHTLPSGNETGVVLHKIMEEIPFDLTKTMQSTDELSEEIRRYVKGTRFETWLSVITDLFEDVVRMPLPGASSMYSLSDVSQDKIFKETEFLYPFTGDELPLDGIEVRPGYLKGVIDLFFEHDGKYYVLDWKSNWLGPDETCYNHEQLVDAMKASKYDLQAAIYTEAMRRYLRLVDQRPFDEIFGGVYYIFLRGIGPGTGILHFNP